MLFVSKMFNLKPFFRSHRFARLRQVQRLKTANVVTDYKDGHIISKENSRVEKKNREKVVDEGRK